jgi:hypothetical protein
MKYQFIFWPIFRRDSWWPLVYGTRLNGSCYSQIYNWVIGIGPLEIRKWK